MNHDLPTTGDLLALVEARSVRLVRLAPRGARSLVRVPITPSLTVAVAARVVEALVEVRPARQVLVLPRDDVAAHHAADLALRLRASNVGPPVGLLPALAHLLAMANCEVRCPPAMPRQPSDQPTCTCATHSIHHRL